MLIAVIAAGVVAAAAIILVQVLTRSHTPDSGDSAAPEHATPPAAIAQIGGLPPGATACPTLFSDPAAPFHAGARGTPMTSCPFVEQTRREYTTAPETGPGPRQLRIASPATGKWYELVCVPSATFVTCSGGVGAVIYLYNP